VVSRHDEEYTERARLTATVEYLVILPSKDSFCDTEQAFLRLLQVDSRLAVAAGDIRYDGVSVCQCRLAHGEVEGRAQRYFHVSLTWPGEPGLAGDSLDAFVSVLRSIRSSVGHARGEVETLWDDLSAYYARTSYPLIHETENLMRRLIANFMLVTVGREWANETLPQEVADAVRKGKRGDGSRDYLNVLHKVDFIHLGEFLFAPYSSGSVQELYARIEDASASVEPGMLKGFVPKSNWQRYFSTLVACEDSYLRSRWEKLYELRCKVAHNALMTAAEAKQIERLVDELKPKLVAAIEKLPRVSVPRAEADAVAENVARGVHAVIGEFISLWQQIESVVVSRLKRRGVQNSRTPSGGELLGYGLIDSGNVALFDTMRATRNEIVHGPAINVPADVIGGYIASLQKLLTTIEERSYIDHLAEMSEESRHEALEGRLDEEKHWLVEEDAVAGAMAETNAFDWNIDDVSIERVELDVPSETCTIRFTFSASGEQDDERMYCGTNIKGEASATIDRDADVQFEDVSASIVDESHVEEESE
jgi:hypothetical protein